MHEIEKWAKEKPLNVVTIAHQCVSSAETLYEILNFSKLSNLPEFFPNYPSISEWLTLYRSHKKNQAILFSHIQHVNDFGKTLYQISKNLNSRTLEKNPERQKPFTKKQKNEAIEHFYKISLTDIVTENLDDQNLHESTEAKKIRSSPVLLFDLKVLLPSLLLYREHPTMLYRKARLGDIGAIDNLLRIDKAIICDKRISKIIFNASAKVDKSTFDRLVNALHGTPVNKISMQRYKVFVSGFLSVFSELLGHRLSAPEIQELFNAYAIDKQIDDLIDPDLQDSPEAFSKAIQRERVLWKPFFS